MIKNKYLIILFLCFCVKWIFAQQHSQYIYHDMHHDKKNENLIKYNLGRISNNTYSGRYLNIMYYSDQYTDADVLLPDSLCGSFLITRVVEKKDNYILKKKLVKQVLYMVDVICTSQEQTPDFICVIIPKEKHQDWKLKMGDTLKVTLYPLFWRDKFLDKQGDSIYTSLPSLKTPLSFVFRNIWIENLQSSYRNYFFIQQYLDPQSIITRHKHI